MRLCGQSVARLARRHSAQLVVRLRGGFVFGFHLYHHRAVLVRTRVAVLLHLLGFHLSFPIVSVLVLRHLAESLVSRSRWSRWLVWPRLVRSRLVWPIIVGHQLIQQLLCACQTRSANFAGSIRSFLQLEHLPQLGLVELQLEMLMAVAEKIVQALHQLRLVAFQQFDSGFGEIVEFVEQPMQQVQRVVLVRKHFRVRLI